MRTYDVRPSPSSTACGPVSATAGEPACASTSTLLVPAPVRTSATHTASRCTSYPSGRAMVQAVAACRQAVQSGRPGAQVPVQRRGQRLEAGDPPGAVPGCSR